MKLTKQQIKQLKSAHKKADLAELELRRLENNLSRLITQFTGVNGFVDLLQGDGFGFTPESNNDTHIPIDTLVYLAEQGRDITEELILDNLSI